MNNDFAEKVRQQIERLKNSPYPTIERDVTEKRIAWFKQKCSVSDRPPLRGSSHPGRAEKTSLRGEDL